VELNAFAAIGACASGFAALEIMPCGDNEILSLVVTWGSSAACAIDPAIHGVEIFTFTDANVMISLHLHEGWRLL